MIYPFVVAIKNKQTLAYNIFGNLLSIISIAFFIQQIISNPDHNLPFLLGSIGVAVVLVWNFLELRKGRKVHYSRALLIAALVWMKMPFMNWIFFLFIALAFAEYQAKYSIEIGFSDEHVLINNLFKKRLPWTEFNNIILKDGILTLDYKNNKVHQLEVEDDEDDDGDEDEFNDYCTQRIKAAHA
ncbi:MAG: hypothetical protein K2P88_05880 [Chitinophagaceae bacterium]|uniref:hypothetical protein n=1 Tax=unclassified Paraflavitalea TaxID=2798305 RepID=UPI003D34FF45|nr:hypothetical protein [Chitinophagaceae bacterium]